MMALQRNVTGPGISSAREKDSRKGRFQGTTRDPIFGKHVDTSEMAAILRGPSAAHRAPDLRGLQLGPWRLCRPLGQGGMGAVWLGERCDAEFRMRVAVKLLKNPLASPQLVERFKRERQFLADLSHPNIAVLHDGGTTPQGLPYLVMESLLGAA